MKKRFLLIISLAFITAFSSFLGAVNNFRGNELEQAIRRSDRIKVEELLNDMNPNEVSRYLELANELISYRSAKSLSDKIDSKSYSSYKFFGNLFLVTSLALTPATAVLSRHEGPIAGACVASIISALLAINILGKIPNKIQVLRDKYNRALAIRQMLIEKDFENKAQA